MIVVLMRGNNMFMFYYLENLQFICIFWLFEELGVEYEFKMYDWDKDMRFVLEEYKNVFLFGMVLVIIDGDFVLFELNVIIEYILDKYGDG